jgi:FkbM family methyltransferase
MNTPYYTLPRDLVLPTPSHAGKILKAMQANRWYEQAMLDYIGSLRLSGTYVDAGAHIGNHVAYFATNTLANQILAFEPSVSAFEQLRELVENNNLASKVSVFNHALADQLADVSCREHVTDSASTYVALAKPLDIVAPLDVSLIKIDVEGAELAVLKGATSILMGCKPRLFIELHSSQQRQVTDDFLVTYGYRASGKVWNHSPTYEYVASS